jgi:hypothetical protein
MNRDFTPFRFRPIVIIGAPRSGTNMLRDALTSCDRAATWPCDEINAIWRHYNARFPSDELQPAQATRSVKRYVRRTFQRLAHRTGAKWIVEKTCANSLRVDFVRAIIPEAKFIFLVRDGYDATASSMKRWRAPFDVRYTLRKARYVPLDDIAILAVRFVANRLYRIGRRDGRLGRWGPTFDGMQEMVRERSLAEVCAEQWSRCVTKAAAALASCPLNQVCFVRYETLVGNPQREMRRVAGFAGIEMREEQLERAASAISPTSVGKGRGELNVESLSRIEPLVRQTMNSLESWNLHTTSDTNRKYAA